MIALYQDPEGKKVFKKEVTVDAKRTRLVVTAKGGNSRILALEQEIESLQALLKQQKQVNFQVIEHVVLPVQLYLFHCTCRIPLNKCWPQIVLAGSMRLSEIVLALE